MLWAHLSCLVLSCLLFSRLSRLVLSSLVMGFFSYWRVRLKDRDRDKDKDFRRGSSTACLLAALRHPLFLSSSFFGYPAPSSLARIAPLSLDLRYSRLAPTLCSIAIGSRLAPTLCYIALGSSLRCPRFTPPLPSVHASVRASGVVVAICFCTRRVSSGCFTGFFSCSLPGMPRFFWPAGLLGSSSLCSSSPLALLVLWLSGFWHSRPLVFSLRAAIVPRFGPLYLVLGFCALLWIFVLCFGSLCFALCPCALLRAFFGLGLRLRTRLAPLILACVFAFTFGKRNF
jgi:hypothetical protein